MPLLRVGLCPLMTEVVIDSFAAQGIKTVIDFVLSDPIELSRSSKIPVQTITSIKRYLLAQHSSFPLNGLNFLEQSIKTLSILSTRCEALDDILCSGVYTGEVTEIIGSSSSGKTQLCTSIAVDVALTLGKSVLYIDRDNGFSAARVSQLVQSRLQDCSIGEVLSRIRVCCCPDVQSLLDAVTATKKLLGSGDSFAGSMKAVIVDSLGAESMMMELPFVEAQSMLTLIQQELATLAKDYALAVLVTSQSSDDGQRGSLLGTTPSTVLCLERFNGLRNPMSILDNPITVRIVKSPHAVAGDTITLKIINAGWEKS